MAETPGLPPGDTGSGPPKGSPYDSPYATPIAVQDRRKAIEDRVGGSSLRIDMRDPGFQPPTDPLDDATKTRSKVIYRDVPIVTIQTSWTVPQARQALAEHMYGNFENSGQLVDAIMGDDRVQATLGSRVGGLFGRELRIRPADDSAAAKEVADAWVDSATDLADGWALKESSAYSILMAFAHGQILWEDTGKILKPHARPWHPRYEWYEWTTRKYIAISQDGNLPILAGDGKWYAHEPFGSYRGWIRGAVRAVTEPWMVRHFAIRDWAGFSEIHGFPIRRCYVPAAADPGERAQFETQVARLGSNTTLLIPRGVDKDLGYDFDLCEAGDTAWESFPGLRDHCDLAIVLAIKFQNLTTEITSGGSYAAAKEHGKGDVAQVAADNRAWRATIRRDFARPFAFLNFGDADLAPITDWDVPQPPREDYTANADMFQKIGTAIEVMRRGGVEFEDVNELRSFMSRMFGLQDVPKFKITEPVAGGAAGGGGGNVGGGK